MRDMQTVYLNVGVKKEVYVKMAPSYENYGKSGTPFVMILKTSLHGLRQSPKNWFGNMEDNMEDYLSNIDFHSPCKSDPCVYASENKRPVSLMLRPLWTIFF